eukprot:TRINITY_DN87452_c0_g1_i1.p1 TRINITY_DN87452_c0_g1~~TRINITY_DN87452_c0_g1_i1.p1  ORF type:complete len:107 (+),score=11.40 TRINITY_DN87452_c0_g1_i1:118-438(+)
MQFKAAAIMAGPPVMPIHSTVGIYRPLKVFTRKMLALASDTLRSIKGSASRRKLKLPSSELWKIMMACPCADNAHVQARILKPATSHKILLEAIHEPGLPCRAYNP